LNDLVELSRPDPERNVVWEDGRCGASEEYCGITVEPKAPELAARAVRYRLETENAPEKLRCSVGVPHGNGKMINRGHEEIISACLTLASHNR